MELLVTGGYFDRSGECFIDRIDPVRGTHERVLSFVPPQAHRVETKGFTGASWLAEDILLVCSFDSVWRFDLSTRRCTGQLHQPDFNDLHSVHVDTPERRIYVCNTGLDSIETFDLEGTFVGRISLTPAWFEAARQAGASVASGDYPHVLTAGWQPHAPPSLGAAGGDYYTSRTDTPFHRRKARDYLHLNHVVRIGEHLLVTSLATRALSCVRSFRSFAILEAHPHDGIWQDGSLWVTTTDGRVWRVKLDTPPVIEVVVDTRSTGHAGWCRGLAVGPDWVAVGLTEIRSAPKYPWRDIPFNTTETSVLWLERATGRLLARVQLGDRDRHAKIFTFLQSPGSGA